MTVDVDTETLKYVVAGIAYVGGLGWAVRSLKKQVNGIGGKLKMLEIMLVRIDERSKFTPINLPEEHKAILSTPTPGEK